jgi:hypothetical protein
MVRSGAAKPGRVSNHAQRRCKAFLPSLLVKPITSSCLEGIGGFRGTLNPPYVLRNAGSAGHHRSSLGRKAKAHSADLDGRKDGSRRGLPRRSLQNIVWCLTYNQREKRHEAQYLSIADGRRICRRLPFSRNGGEGRGRVYADLVDDPGQRHHGDKECVQRQAEKPELRRREHLAAARLVKRSGRAPRASPS